MPNEVLNLRAVALRLASMRDRRADKPDIEQLHTLLRAGELRAGFYFAGGASWIEIPLTYWETVPFRKMRKIGRISNDENSGSYRLRPDRFPEQVAEHICNLSEPAPQRVLEVAEVVAASAKQHEVAIKEENYRAYLARHGIEEPRTGSPAGRDRKESWRELCAYMAAYFAAHYRDLPGQELKISQAAEEIIEIAKKDVSGLSSPATLKEYVSKAKQLISREDFDLKKKPIAGDARSSMNPAKAKSEGE